MLSNLIIVFNTSPHTHNMHCTRPFGLTSPIFTLVGARNANPRWTVTSQPIAVRVWHRMSEIGHVSGISCCWHTSPCYHLSIFQLYRFWTTPEISSRFLSYHFLPVKMSAFRTPTLVHMKRDQKPASRVIWTEFCQRRNNTRKPT